MAKKEMKKDEPVIAPPEMVISVPRYNAEGVLLNPGECEVDGEGIARGKLIPKGV